eukprot:GAHX01002407.1.p1 GENE.GAHX01002407.1~~GAHX01002407.1.p1  ORF type:complete len:169 (-),score=29.69 GAHX01002407.1:122-628(-)
MKNNKEFREKVERNLKELPEMGKFIEAYIQALQDSSTNIYKETEVNISPFIDNDDDETSEDTVTLFLIQDFDKVENLVFLTFYHICLYIFTYDTEKKEIHLSSDIIDSMEERMPDSLETLDKQVMKINTSCSKLFKINIKELGNHSLPSNASFKDCLENIRVWMFEDE